MKACVRRVHRVFLLAVGGAVALAGCSRPREEPVAAAVRSLTAESIGRHGRALSGEELAGRYYASPEADSAAAYILSQLRAARLQPVQRAENLLGAHPACFAHHFSVTLHRVTPLTRLSARSGRNERNAQLGYEFMPLVFARGGEIDGTVTWIPRTGLPGDLGPRVRDRIVLVPPDVWRADAETPIAARLYRLARRLEEQGARAVLFAGDTDLLYNDASTFPSLLTPELRAAVFSARGSLTNLHADRASLTAQADAWRHAPAPTLPAAVVRSSWASRLQEGDALQLGIGLAPEVSLGQSILAGFRGHSRPEEIVMLTAHYDHTGINADGDVLNGADDNASGVAALLEIARTLPQLVPALERSIVIAFLSGERQGLQGSEALIGDLPRLLGPEVRVVANLSLRAVGRNAARPLLLHGGNEHPLIASVFDAYNNRESLLAAPLALQREALRSSINPGDAAQVRASAHLAFGRAGIPSVLVNDGLDASLYGQPDDDWKYVDSDKVARVARLCFRAAYDLATQSRPAALPASTH
jgi:hypothetical protein